MPILFGIGLLLLFVVIMISSVALGKKKKPIAPEQKPPLDEKELSKILQNNRQKINALHQKTHPSLGDFKDAVAKKLGFFNLTFSDDDWTKLALFFSENTDAKADQIVEECVIQPLKLGEKDEAAMRYNQAKKKAAKETGIAFEQIFRTPLPEEVIKAFAIPSSEEWRDIFIKNGLTSSEKIEEYCKKTYPENPYFPYAADREFRRYKAEEVLGRRPHSIYADQVIEIWNSIQKPLKKSKSKL